MSWKPNDAIWDEAERKAQERLRKEFGQWLRNDGAAQSTIDALMYSLRRGIAALGYPIRCRRTRCGDCQN